MTPDQSQSDGRVGKAPDRVDAETPGESDIADALGFTTESATDSRSADNETDDPFASADGESELLETLVQEHRELAGRVERLERENDRLQEQVAEKDKTIAQQRKTIERLTDKIFENQESIQEVEDTAEESKEIAKSATAKVQQIDADSDQQEDAEDLPHGVEPSTSPLDFFSNCRQLKIKKVFVDTQHKPNTYRAIRVAKWWDEFGTVRSNGDGVFFTREDMKQCLTALLSREPHPQTISRVWDKLREIGGDDISEKRRTVGRKQEAKKILAMDMDTAEGLLEKRYVGLDLIDGSESKAAAGGVTPVVMSG